MCPTLTLNDKLSIVAQKAELMKCLHPVTGEEYWFEKYAVTFDEIAGEVKAYPMWPFQSELIRWLQTGGKKLTEKPRDMMVTWTGALHCLYSMVFRPNWTGFAISRQEKEVDDGGEKSTVHSIMGRMRFSWEQLPDWMRGEVVFSKLKIRNLESGMNTLMTGEATKPTSGQSIHVTFKWGDEFAQVDQSEKVHGSMSGGNYRTLWYSSVTSVDDCAFKRLRHDPSSGFEVFTLTWDMNPTRDHEWYEAKVAGLNPVQRATQVDVQYEVADTTAMVYKRFKAEKHVKDARECPQEGEEYYIGFDNGFSKPGAMEFGILKDGHMTFVRERYSTNIPVRVPEKMRESNTLDWVSVAEEMERSLFPGLEKGKHVVKRVCIGWTGESKKNEAQAVAVHFQNAGFKTYCVAKSKANRVQDADAWMMDDPAGQPFLTFSTDCVKLLWEIPRYWYERKQGQTTEKPQNKNDHAIEAMEAICEYATAPVRRPGWTSDLAGWIRGSTRSQERTRANEEIASRR